VATFLSAAIRCVVIYGCVFLFIWIQMNQNTTVREVKRLELQLLRLANQLEDYLHENKDA